MSDKPRKALYGRRQGRPLRDEQQRLMDELLPRLALRLPGEGENLDLETLFGPDLRDYWLEIGFGGGEHLAWQAAQEAEKESSVGLIGAEFFINGIAKLLRQVDGTPACERLRLFQGDARDLLKALPAGRLSRIFILFPDPWPKLRHHKRRIIQRESLDLITSLLRPGGELRIASDDPSYQTWILRHLQTHPAFRWTAKDAKDWRERPVDWPATRYGEKALAAGRQPIYLSYERLPDSTAG